MNFRSSALAVATTLCFALAASAGAPERAASSPQATGSQAPGPLTYTPPTLPEAPSATSLLLRLCLATAVVLALAGGAAVAVRRLAPRVPAGKSDPRLRLVETLQLGNGSSLHLLECCGRRFVAGVSPAGFRSLAPLTEPFENELDEFAALS